MTGQDAVNSALRLLNVLDPAEVPSVSESADGLLRLNNMLDSWSVERLNVLSVGSQILTITSGSANVTISPRPIKVEAVNVVWTSASGFDHHDPVELIDVGAWNALSFKSMRATQPTKCYYDKDFAAPTLHLYPTPSFSAPARSLEVYVWKVPAQFPDLTTDVPMPPAYERAIRFNLAIEYSAEYSAEPRAAVIELAKESKAALRMLNVALAGQEPDTGPVNAIPS